MRSRTNTISERMAKLRGLEEVQIIPPTNNNDGMQNNIQTAPRTRLPSSRLKKNSKSAHKNNPKIRLTKTLLTIDILTPPGWGAGGKLTVVIWSVDIGMRYIRSRGKYMAVSAIGQTRKYPSPLRPLDARGL
jgi:hypothetical protein